MTNTLAIAAVTAMLKDILENRLANHPVAISIGDLLVTALPPDRITIGSDERPQLNVFLYQVSQNRNADWVGRDQLAESKSNDLRESKAGKQTALALDLHYLITAYGAKDFQAELLLGYAMQVLHDIPLITQEMVCTALKHAAAMTTFGALSQVLATMPIDNLAAQVGTIKLCPEFFSMEETSKLWSSLQTHYRPSAGYQASMVLLDRHSEQTNSSESTLIPMLHPTIEQISSPTKIIHAGATVMVHGQRLQGTFTYLRLTGRSSLLTPQTVEDKQITLLLPPDLPAGIQTLQVVHLNKSRSVGVEEIQSNRVAFIIQPTIHAQIISIQPLQQDYQVNLALTITPLINPSQQVVLLLNHLSNNLPLIQLTVPSIDIPTKALTVPLQIAAGHYWLQLQVDGARSEAIKIEVKN